MSLTNYLEEKLLKHALGIAAYTPTDVYLALSSASPTESGGWTEFTGAGYARVKVAFNPAEMSGANWGAIVRSSDPVQLGPATSSWMSSVYVGFFDALTGGNLLAFNSNFTMAMVSSGDYLKFAARDLSVALDTSQWSDYALKGLLDLGFRNPPTANQLPCGAVYGAICGSTPSHTIEEASSSNLNEISGTNYSRVQLTPWGAVSQNGSGAAQAANSADIDYPTAGSNWGGTIGFAVCTAQTGGKLLLSIAPSPSPTINNGDIARISNGSLLVAIG